MSEDMSGKIVLVTGANSGIGYETAAGLSAKGALVVMVCRDEKKGMEARKSAIKKTGNPHIDLMTADFSSLATVRRFAADFSKKYEHLHVLVNNAGAIFFERQMTADGCESTFQVNHLAPFLLTNLLLPLLKNSTPSRIVTVSSDAHYSGHIDFNDLMSEKNYKPMAAYSASKLANVLFSNELARMLEGTGVVSNSLHPGVVKTNFGRKGTTIGWKIFFSLFGPVLLPPEKGARTSIYLASSDEAGSLSGLYFANSRPKRASNES